MKDKYKIDKGKKDHLNMKPWNKWLNKYIVKYK